MHFQIKQEKIRVSKIAKTVVETMKELEQSHAHSEGIIDKDGDAVDGSPHHLRDISRKLIRSHHAATADFVTKL